MNMNMNAGVNPFAAKPVDYGQRMMNAGINNAPKLKASGDSLLQRLAQFDGAKPKQAPPANQNQGFAAAFSLNTLG